MEWWWSWWYCFATIAAPLLAQAYNSAIVTGSTGTLGSAMVSALCERNLPTVVLGYRRHQAIQALERLLPASSSTMLAKMHLDLEDVAFGQPVSHHFSVPGSVLLLNNAAVCLHGSSPSVLARSLTVNVLAPVLLAKEALLQAPRERVTVINVSSGDGELLWLNSQLRRELLSLHSLDELLAYLYEQKKHFRYDLEYAAGSTPMYSFSKALLNRATVLLQQTAPPNANIMACCPGNFLSPMNSVDEVGDEVVSPQTAAEDVLALAFEQGYSGGCFYRRRQRIPW